MSLGAVLSNALSGLAVAQTASAQDYDDRWYLTPGVGFNVQDNQRGTNNAPFVALGFGKNLSSTWSLDAQLNYQKPTFGNNRNNLRNPNVAGAVSGFGHHLEAAAQMERLADDRTQFGDVFDQQHGGAHCACHTQTSNFQNPDGPSDRGYIRGVWVSGRLMWCWSTTRTTSGESSAATCG